MLPKNFLNHTCQYSLNLNGFNIQARVVEEYKGLVDSGIAEFISKLDTSFPIVGFDLKHVKLSDSLSQRNFKNYLLLVLYTKDHCLLLKLTTYLFSYYFFRESSLSRFLNDKSICFLGWEVFEKVKLLGGIGSKMESCVNVCSFAARVMKKREFEKCLNLVELASKVGAAKTLPADEASQIMKTVIEIPYYQDFNDVCFSVEEVKYAVLDAYWCYTIGTKLINKP